MAIGFNNTNGIAAKLARNLATAGNHRADAIEKLSTGTIFTARNPQPAQRAVSESMDFRLRSLAAAKRNINDAVSLLQTGESSLSEINNIIVRMKELNISGATTTVTDKERRFLFIEYNALHEELDRIATTTEFNGIPLLNGNDDRTPEELIFRVDDPNGGEEGPDGDDVNIIRFTGLKEMVATTAGLGLSSVTRLLNSSSDAEGISLDDVTELLIPNEDGFATIYDEALSKISTQRAEFGAMQTRMQHAMDFVDVYQENIASAKATISDTDYARETVRLAESNILMQASTGLLAQTNFDANMTFNLLSAVTR